MNNYLVWSNDDEPRRGFVESVGAGGIYFTTDIKSAFQFTDKDEAESLANTLESADVLELL